MTSGNAGFEIRIETDQAIRELDMLKKAYRRLRDEFKAAGMGGREAGVMARRELSGAIDRGQPIGPKTQTGTKGFLTNLQRSPTALQAAGFGAKELGGLAATGAESEDRRTEASLTKVTGARDRLTAAVQKQIGASRQLRGLEAQLGHNAGINTVQVIKQREALAALTVQVGESIRAGKLSVAAGREKIKVLVQEEVQLRKMQPTVEQYNQKMRFMGGASVGAQKGIRNVGAAAQGSMLAMSAMNGDVLGLAFSLIFLQFAANIPVALGFGAVALAGALAFKRIKGVLEERRAIEKMGNAFYIVTRSTQAMTLATQRAEGITKDLGLSTKDQEEADKALIATQQNLRANGIEPTSDALKVALNAFLIAKAGGEEYEAALESTLQSTSAFADGGIPKIGSVAMTMEEMESRGGAALAMLTRSIVAQDEPMSALVKRADELGIEVPKSYREAGDAGETLGDVQDNLIGQIDSGNVMALEWMHTLEDWGNEVLANSDDHISASERINKAFDSMGSGASENLAKGGKADLGWEQFNTQLSNAITNVGDAEDGIRELAEEAARNAKAGGLEELENRLLNIANNAKLVADNIMLAGPQTIVSAVEGRGGDMETDYLMSKIAENSTPAIVRDMEIDAMASQMYEKGSGFQGPQQTINITVSGNIVQSEEALVKNLADNLNRETHPYYGEIIL